MDITTVLTGAGLVVFGAPGVVGYLYGGPSYAIMFVGAAFVASYLLTEIQARQMRPF